MKLTDIPHCDNVIEYRAADSSMKWDNLKPEQVKDLTDYYKDVRVRKFVKGSNYKNVLFFEVAIPEGAEVGVIPSMFISFSFLKSIHVWNNGADRKEISIVWDDLPDEEVRRIKSMYSEEDVKEWIYNPDSGRIRLSFVRKSELPAGDAPSQSK